MSLLGNYALVSMVTGLALVTTFVSIAVLLRLLGADELGLLVYARLLSTNGIWQLLEPGLRLRLTRMTAATKSEIGLAGASGLVVSAAQTLFLIAVVTVAAALWFSDVVLSQAISNEVDRLRFEPIFWVGVSLWLIELPVITFNGFLEGAKKFAFLKTVDLSHVILLGFFLMAGAYFGLKFEVLAYSCFAASMLRNIAIVTVASRLLNLRAREFVTVRKKDFRSLFDRSGYFLSGNWLGQFYAQLEKLVFVIFFQPHIIVLLEIISKLPQALRLITDSCRPVMISFLTRGDGRDGYFDADLLRAVLALYVIIGVLPAMLVWLSAETILSLWVGPEYSFVAPFMMCFLAYNMSVPCLNFLRDMVIAKNSGFEIYFRFQVVEFLIRVFGIIVIFSISKPLAIGLCALAGLSVTPFFFQSVSKAFSLSRSILWVALSKAYLAMGVTALAAFMVVPHLTVDLSPIVVLVVTSSTVGMMSLVCLYLAGMFSDLARLANFK